MIRGKYVALITLPLYFKKHVKGILFCLSIFFEEVIFVTVENFITEIQIFP